MIRHTRDSVYMNDGRRLIRTSRSGRGTGVGPGSDTRKLTGGAWS